MAALLRSTASTNWWLKGKPSCLPYRYQGKTVASVLSNKFVNKQWLVTWPCSRSIGAGNMICAVDYRPSIRANRIAGAGATRAFTGITRDSASAPLGSATIKLFRTATNELIAQSTSDAGGAYQVVTPYADAHFIVAYKAGAPDVSGTTVNTLIGS